MATTHPHLQPHPDLIARLTQRAYYNLVYTLTARLPPPPDDSPDSLLARDQAAIDEVAAMAPVNADEASMAAHCVAVRAQAFDVLRLIRGYTGDDTGILVKLNAQYVHMERAASSQRSLLQRLQAARRKRDAIDAQADADAWTRHIATQEMQLVLNGAARPAEATPLPALPDTPPPLAQLSPMPAGTELPRMPAATPEAAAPAAPAPQRGRRPSPAAPAEYEDPPRNLASEVEYYAAVYPRRAQRIRQCGGLPPDCDFGPPDDALVHAIVASTSPAVRALDSPNAAL